MNDIHYRKNINCLTNDELHELRETFAAMCQRTASDPNSFAREASFHGGPPVAYCRHGAPGFFSWHRAEMKGLRGRPARNRLQNSAPLLGDWSSGPTTGIPEACHNPTYVNRAGDTVPNPLFSGPRPGGGMTTWSASIDTTSFADLAVAVQTAMRRRYAIISRRTASTSTAASAARRGPRCSRSSQRSGQANPDR